jgi:hypothetical protein
VSSREMRRSSIRLVPDGRFNVYSPLLSIAQNLDNMAYWLRLRLGLGLGLELELELGLELG